MEKLREVRLTPYRKGHGPRFRLQTFDTFHRDSDGKAILTYKLWQDSALLFEGADFHCSPLYGIDSDEAIRSLMTFLTLRPGDTDADYFDAYTPEQLEFADRHAEALNWEVVSRFGEN